MTEVKYDPLFENSPEDQEIIKEVNAELGQKELSEYTDEQLADLYKSTEQESYITNDVNQTRTPEEHRQDVQKRLENINAEIKARKNTELDAPTQDLGSSIH